MNKKIAVACLGCMLIISPCRANDRANLSGIYAGINAIVWLGCGIVLAKKKNLFKVPLKRQYSLALVSFCGFLSTAYLAKFIYSMANKEKN